MHFQTGNLWLIVGLFLILGKTTVRYEPVKYSFFGSQAVFEPSTYHGFIAFALGAAGVSLLLAFRNRNKVAQN